MISIGNKHNSHQTTNSASRSYILWPIFSWHTSVTSLYFLPMKASSCQIISTKMMKLRSLFLSKSPVLEDILGRGRNSFDLIRLIASLFVIFGHAFALHPPNGHVEPIASLIQFDYIGTIAVYTFLFISGIFVTASYDQSRNLFRFVILRIGRVWPALIVCILITVFIVGPSVTSLTTSAYFDK